MLSTLIAFVGHVCAAFIILFIPAPFWLITDDFGFDLVCLFISKTSGAIVSQLQQPMHKLLSTSTKIFGCSFGSFALSNSPFLPSGRILALYSFQKLSSYFFQKSGSFSSNSRVYLPQSSSGIFCSSGAAH